MNNKVSKYEGDRSYYPSFINRFFDDDFFSGFGSNSLPAVNVKETKKEFKLEISAPGFEKGDFDVKVEKNILKISAARESSHEEKDEDERVLRQEFTSSTFSRAFTLPEHVDTEKIEAKEKNGILTIKLPKKNNAVEDSVKKIEIK